MGTTTPAGRVVYQSRNRTQFQDWYARKPLPCSVYLLAGERAVPSTVLNAAVQSRTLAWLTAVAQSPKCPHWNQLGSQWAHWNTTPCVSLPAPPPLHRHLSSQRQMTRGLKNPYNN